MTPSFKAVFFSVTPPPNPTSPHYLVKNERSLMPKAERLSEKWTVGQEAKLRGQLIIWGQCFSRGHFSPIYKQAGNGFIYFIKILNKKFSLSPCSFLGLYSVEIKSDDRYQIILTNKKKRKKKKRYQIGRRISSDNYHPICITWSVLSNERVKKLFCGL